MFNSQKTIRIVHLITTLETGGAESMLFKLVAHSNKNSKFKHMVISLTGKGFYGHLFEREKIPVYWLNLKARPNGFLKLTRLVHLLKDYKPDILQTWLYHADLIGLICGYLSNVKHIIWNVRCSDMELKQYAWTTRLIFKKLSWLSGLPDAICVNSQAGIEYHSQNGYHPKKWVLLPNGFNIDRFMPASSAADSWLKKSLRIPLSAMVIGMVARFDPMKDYENCLLAARILSRTRKDVCFILIGKDVDASNAYLLSLIKRFKLIQNVFLLGQRTDLDQIYPEMDIFTLSSLYGEGFPNVIGEAMACGVPCVATNVGDARRIIGDTGIVVSRRDPIELAQAWLTLIHMTSQERKAMGLSARQRIIDHYSISIIQKRYEDLYNTIVTNI